MNWSLNGCGRNYKKTVAILTADIGWCLQHGVPRNDSTQKSRKPKPFLHSSPSTELSPAAMAAALLPATLPKLFTSETLRTAAKQSERIHLVPLRLRCAIKRFLRGPFPSLQTPISPHPSL